MVHTDRHLPQDAHVRTKDFQIVQALHETRVLAARHAEPDDADPAWTDLIEQVDRVTHRIGGRGGEPAAHPDLGMDRIERTSFTLAPAVADRTIGALMALGDRPDAHQLTLARQAVGDLEDALR